VGVVDWDCSSWFVALYSVNKENRSISSCDDFNKEGIEDGEVSEWEILDNIYENSTFNLSID